MALSKLRNHHMQSVKTEARCLIKHNLKNYKGVPRNARMDAKWMKFANLGPIFDYLA